ncbi:MAG TPA: DUF6484 domain-containing protein [Planctomycetota bacterium]|nr:DUF6484 domain-containing protein [Planctomycetota bacterium]
MNNKKKMRALPQIEGVVIGMLLELDVIGSPRVDYPGNPGGPLPARTAVALDSSKVGREVALMFESGDSARPIVLGILQRPGRPEPKVQVEMDGETLVLTGKKEIVLRCGKASLTLTRAGKILLRGAYVSSRSSGVNRIKGGSVQIN